MDRPSLFDELRQSAPDVIEVAAALGCDTARGAFGPCPACNVDRREAGSRRLPCDRRAGGNGWICARCKATGDVARLAAWRVAGSPKPDGAGWRAVAEALAARGWCSSPGAPSGAWVPPPRRDPLPEKAFPDPAELRALLGACRRVDDVPEVERWCRQDRGFGAHIPAAVLPDLYRWPAWWPFRGAPWRLVVSMVDAAGVVRSLHARATDATSTPKTRWPYDVRARGLLFADPLLGRPMLAGKADPAHVLVVEGMTDYLAAASRAPSGWAVLGACSGGFGALADARIPKAARVIVATDADEQGEKYAQEVYRALRGRDVRRWSPRRT